jgi:hypothetical protein
MCPRILKQELSLNEFEKQILIGYLLGDGHIETWKNSKVARLKVEQGLEQKDFVDWLFEIFGRFVKTPPKIKSKSIYFNTLSSKELYLYKEKFYFKSKKIIPDEIDLLLTPLSLAVWFMGDGSIKSKECNGRIINTHGFREPEINKLCHILQDKFTLKASIRRQKDGLQIYISAKSARELYNLISPHLLPYFEYKLPKFKS